MEKTMRKITNIVLCVGMFVFLTLTGGWLFFKTPDAYSMSERRTLKTKTELTWDNLWSGKFMQDYEDYALDQFPARDTFRTIKAMSEYYVFRKKDSNGLYQKDGYLSKLEYPRKEAMQEHAAERFGFLYDTFLKEKGITPYLVIVPDKNYYLAKDGSMLTLDYEELYASMNEKIPYMEQIDIRDLLEAGDYYYTDTHWRQDQILDVAERILSVMNPEGTISVNPEEAKTLETPFYGVYVGQSALPVKPDEIRYFTSNVLENCKVLNYETGMPVEMSVYDFQKAKGADGYDFFLSGASPFITIENPAATTDKELVMFRDSFGSSLAPLLVESYRKVTLVDIRYVQSGMLGGLIDFDNQDVLFLYSTLLLNSSLGMK